MKKTIILLLLSVFAFLGFAENVVCPHCGKSFEYTKNTETRNLNAEDYEVVPAAKLNLSYKNYIKNGTKICLKDMKCNQIHPPKDIYIYDKSHTGIVSTFDESTSEPDTMDKLIELKASGKRADYYGYAIDDYYGSFVFKITAIRTAD